MQFDFRIVIFLICCFLAACTTSSRQNSGGAIPRDEFPSPYGNPKKYTALGKTYYVKQSSEGYKERGLASWYGKDFHGKRTSSGTPYDMHGYSAAHKTLPIPSYVRVTNLENNKHIILRVDDRGPFKPGRIIDLSFLAAKSLGVVAAGTAKVEVEALAPYQDLNKKRIAPSTHTIANAPIIKAYAVQNNSVDNNKSSGSTDFVEAATGVDEIPLLSQSQSQSQIFIQLGAFGEHKNAEYLLEKAKSYQFYDAKINNDTLYRVTVGPYYSNLDMNQALDRLRSSGFESLKIVKN